MIVRVMLVVMFLLVRPVSAAIPTYNHAFVAFSGGIACVSGSVLYILPPTENMWTGGHCNLYYADSITDSGPAITACQAYYAARGALTGTTMNFSRVTSSPGGFR